MGDIPWAQHFISTLFLFYSFYALNGFNHLASLAGDLVEITNEKDDGPVEEILEDTEEISDYNIGERTNRALFLKLIDNIVKDELENSLKRDII